jgi:hypothetical protein
MKSMLMTIASEAKLKIGRESNFSLTTKFAAYRGGNLAALVCPDGKLSMKEKKLVGKSSTTCPDGSVRTFRQNWRRS